MSFEELVGERDRLEAWLKQQPGVVGTGIGLGPNGRPSIKVFSNHIPTATRNAIVERFGAVPVLIEETGEIRKQHG